MVGAIREAVPHGPTGSDPDDPEQGDPSETTIPSRCLRSAPKAKSSGRRAGDDHQHVVGRSEVGGEDQAVTAV